MIEDAIRNGANTLQQVMDATGAGKGCGKCKELIWRFPIPAMSTVFTAIATV